MAPQRKYDSTVARMAANIASGVAREFLFGASEVDEATIARDCVSLARAIVAEVERTEPSPEKVSA